MVEEGLVMIYGRGKMEKQSPAPQMCTKCLEFPLIVAFFVKYFIILLFLDIEQLSN